ncbi:sigma-54-dependent Fis family transcriptional regulator [Cohnella zeiphila]|uniref:PrpR N-terminal domain-containing protein n=1 Tax=Cohnella zeiphila TaxID=2761120 RepID=A0A7X0SIN0_9BACL|nr:sigma-54-dependent Fis family transcriptional regulator [Cohnella zeiphila]MBB6730667.1 PrpR N-terminal domain-containing protein [Cohnella zeiphila]
MKIKALVVAPYEGLIELINQLSSELPEFEITSVLGDLSEGLHVFKERYVHKEFDVVISRGGTAALLREHISAPVVDIQVSGFDILRMLTLLKGYRSKIKMIGFPNVIQGFAAVSSLMNVEIPYAEIHHEDEVEAIVKRAKEEGVIVVVGDNVTARLANEWGMQGVLITSGRESVMDAFRTAKQLCKVLRAAKIRNSVYGTLLDQVEEGFAMVDEDGGLTYANRAFKKLLQLPETEIEVNSIFAAHPFFREFVRFTQERPAPAIPVLYETERKLAVAASEVESLPGCHLIKLQEFKSVSGEIYVIYHKKSSHHSFPQIIMTGEAFRDARLTAERRFEAGLPVAVYGEMGSGKMLFMHMLYQSERYPDGSLAEIVIQGGGEETCGYLQRLLQSVRPGALAYIRGLEKVPVPMQRKLIPLIKKARGRLVFSFVQDPKRLKDELLLDAKMYDLLAEDIVFLSPLRENVRYFEELVRTFIVQYNEKYGKQVVGVRPKVLDALRSHPWRGNFIELKEMTEQFVRSATGEYIEEDALGILGNSSVVGWSEGPADTKRINIHQPLEEIERDIIRMVMEEENMNQSKAAKRLKINRATLWRKLKEEK